MGLSDARLLSRPCDVYFAGFRSDTHRLQQAGWQLSAEQDIRMRAIRLAMRHEGAQLYAMTSAVPYDFFEDANHYGHRLPEFQVQHVSSRMTVQLMESQFNFRPIDATPQYTEIKRRDIEDFGIFAVPLARTEEIIVAPETVADLLDKIKRMQAPELTAIRERNRRRHEPGTVADAMPETTFHAQIVSLRAA